MQSVWTTFLNNVRLRVWLGIAALLALPPGAAADVVTPVLVQATSEFGAIDVFGDGNFSSVFVTNLIDGSGLIDSEETPDDVLDDLHDNDFSSSNGWHAGEFDAGVPGGLDGDNDWLTAPRTDEQVLVFTLAQPYELTSAHVWQQNQGPLFGPPPAEARGVDEFSVLASTSLEGDSWTAVGDFRLDVEFGTEAVPAQSLSFDEAVLARRIRFDILSAHSGAPNEYVGLSEVRFEGTPVNLILGDFNLDGDLDAGDIDLLTRTIVDGGTDAKFDLDGDGQLSGRDREVWVEDLKRTWFGDANLDGLFDTSDFVTAFTAGEYEDGQLQNSRWATGDWNGDLEFDSGDFVVAFTGGGFEAGPRQALAAVPEPNRLAFYGCPLALGLLAWSRQRVANR